MEKLKNTILGKIPLGWSVENLEDNLEKIIDYRGKTPTKAESGVITLSAKSVKMNYIDYSNAYYVSKETYDKFMVRGFPKKGDILMTTEAPLGCIAELNKEDVCVAQRLLTLRGKKEKLLNKYLMYYLQSNIGQHELLSKASGTTVQGIKRTEFSKVNIILPPLETQEKIASILSALDDKIEINNEMNKTLEEMAQTLFKRWFIDFDFPNENGEPYRSSDGKMVDSELGEIPEGWEVVSFSELIELFNGYSYKGKELMKSNNAMITIKNFNRNGGFQVEGFKEISISDKVRENHYVNKGDVIVAHTDLTQGAEIIGNSIYIQTFGKYEKIITSMDTVKIKSKNHEISNLLIHMFLNHKKFKEHALGYVNGTTVLHLSKKAIPEYKIAIPINKKIFDNMDKLLKPIYKEQNLKLEEIWELTKLRDTLLPKLMSGEVEI